MSRRSGSERGFEYLLEFVDSELAFETDFYNDAYVDRRITARMRRTDTGSYRAYRRLLERDDAERDALLGSLSINVTGFFRDPGAWEQLRPVLRSLTDDHRTVDVWSAPAADGREPYSLAMLAIDDPGIDASRIEILATDINSDVLDTAREGVYETSQTTDIAEELEPLSALDPYLEQDGTTFRVRDTVEEMVTFEQHDLIRGEQKRDRDLVLCRNLLIYIDASYKESVFETITGSLRGTGYLMTGMTETVPAGMRDAFDPVDKQHRIYRKE